MAVSRDDVGTMPDRIRCAASWLLYKRLGRLCLMLIHLIHSDRVRPPVRGSVGDEGREAC